MTKSDDPTIEECNLLLNEIEFVTTKDSLYCIALTVLCKSAMFFKEQRLHVATMLEDVEIDWLRLAVKS